VGYSNLYMWVLWMISGTALNLIVMQRLISIITLCPLNCRRYMGLTRSRFSSFTVHWIRQEPMITSSVCVSHSRWALLAQWM
jgi:hypothetical protein